MHKDLQKELIVYRLNDLLAEVYKDYELSLIVNVDFQGKPFENFEGIKSVGLFKGKNLINYIDIKDDTPEKVFLRLSEIIYKTLEANK